MPAKHGHGIKAARAQIRYGIPIPGSIPYNDMGGQYTALFKQPAVSGSRTSKQLEVESDPNL
jgi:hypothetical protein